MQSAELIARAAGKARRVLANNLCRRMVPIRGGVPIISFTFDDAPKSALNTGQEILKAYGARATYFVSLGILGSDTEVGKIACPDDLTGAVEDGSELGCHTFDHLDAWHTPCEIFITSIDQNRKALRRILPGARFTSFAYPKSGAKLSTKWALQETFACCRGGGQAANVGSADLNLLKACFLDRRTGAGPEFIQTLIDHNTKGRGWLIFVTHDVSANPSPYGCTPEFLDFVVRYSSQSGAMLLPVGEACARVTASAYSES